MPPDTSSQSLPPPSPLPHVPIPTIWTHSKFKLHVASIALQDSMADRAARVVYTLHLPLNTDSLPILYSFDPSEHHVSPKGTQIVFITRVAREHISHGRAVYKERELGGGGGGGGGIHPFPLHQFPPPSPPPPPHPPTHPPTLGNISVYSTA